MTGLLFCFLCVLSLCNGQHCNDETKRESIESHDGYNLSVSAVFEDSNRLTLICSLINATLLSGQELIWTEGNVEVNYSDVDKVVTSTSSILNIDNITEAHYGVYTCQCYNRQNYTLNELHKLINNEFYVHHCSENISVTAIPTASNITTRHHYVDTPGDNVTVDCISTLNKVLSNTTELVPVVGGVITVFSPKDQGKFLCVSESTIMEIHYISIKDYEAVQFILPTSIQIKIPFNINSNDPPPLCAVYSPLTLEMFSLKFYIAPGQFLIGGLNPYHRREPIGEHLSTLQLIPNKGNDDLIEHFFLVCTAKTVWEEKSYTYRIKFDRGAAELVPSLCVTASITPSISPVVSGSTVTLTCLVYSDIGLSKTNVTIVHEMTNGTIRKLLPQQDSTLNLFQSNRYILTLRDISIAEDDGEYICRAVIEEFTIEVEESVILIINKTSYMPSSTYPRPMTSIFSSFSTSSLPVIVTSDSSTSPTQVLQFRNIIDLKLILVTIVPCFVIIVLALIIAIISVVVVYLVLRSSQRRYEVTTMKDKTAMENPYIVSQH